MAWPRRPANLGVNGPIGWWRFRPALSAGGDEKARQGGWLKDKFVTAMLRMKKLDIDALMRACAGQ
jgi:hypothetical protein